jgi:hypothetical protein
LRMGERLDPILIYMSVLVLVLVLVLFLVLVLVLVWSSSFAIGPQECSVFLEFHGGVFYLLRFFLCIRAFSKLPVKLTVGTCAHRI